VEGLYWVKLMKFFYDEDKETDEDVLEAWYNYCFYFLPFVNKQWRGYLAPFILKEMNCIFQCVTSSDEAIVRWFLTMWYKIIIEEIQSGTLNVVKKGKGYGPHDIKNNIDSYTRLYGNIKKCRQDKETKIRWNAIFWKEVKNRSKDMFVKKEQTKYKNSYSKKIYEALPDMDDDDDLFGYKEVQIKSDSDDDSEIEPDEVGS
jgi:hypothetical protein